ncbi:hypothetical protein ABBQ32_004969 [Trebouxia sp. C0010 RCD-2024]
MQSCGLTAYHWCLVGLDLAYLFLGWAAAKGNKYPASRHQNTFVSKCWVGTHIVLGAIVIYGGAVIFILDNQSVSFKNTWVLRLLAVAAVLHSSTVPGMLSKVPGCRKLNVPYYVGTVVINLYTAIQVLCTPTVQNLMQLWGALNAFVYVRLFVFLFHIVSGGADYMVVYTLAMGLAGYFATVANGLHGLSLLIIISPVVGAPLMVSYSRWYHSTFTTSTLTSVESAVVGDATAADRSGGLLFLICSAIHDALDPVDVPHQPSVHVGWYRSLLSWFAADNLPVGDAAKVAALEFTV